MARKKIENNDYDDDMPNDYTDQLADEANDVTRFQKGNVFWQLADGFPRKKKFESPEELFNLCIEYFQWCDENPLTVMSFEGRDAKSCFTKKLRAYTWEGLSVHLGVAVGTLHDYRKLESHSRFHETMSIIDSIIFTQNLTAAAAGLLSASLIGRHLGIAETVKTEHSVDNNTVQEVFKFGDKLLVFGNASKEG
jgi:hypothetical protein